MSREKKYLRYCAAFISSAAVGLSIGASWLLLGNGDATELIAASAIVAFGAPLQFLRRRAPPSTWRSDDSAGKSADPSSGRTIS